MIESLLFDGDQESLWTGRSTWYQCCRRITWNQPAECYGDTRPTGTGGSKWTSQWRRRSSELRVKGWRSVAARVCFSRSDRQVIAADATTSQIWTTQ